MEAALGRDPVKLASDPGIDAFHRADRRRRQSGAGGGRLLR